jgi:hypothetical protein
MDAVYDEALDAESVGFAKGKPSGIIVFTATNAACAEEFRPGQAYFVDFTPIPEPEEEA